MNLNKDLGQTGTQMTLFSQEVFLASHTQPPGSDLEKKMNATCGPKCLESYGRFNRNGLWAKTFSALLIGQEGWFSRRCRLTWKVKGTKYNRMYFQLRVSTLPTNEIGFGLWLSTPRAAETPRSERFAKGRTLSPSEYAQKMGLLKTPTAMDGKVTSGKKNPVSGNSGTLAQEIMSGYKPTMEKLGLLPTPESFDWNSARHPELWEKDKKKYAEKGINLHCNLRQMARLSLLPTPRAQERDNSKQRIIKGKIDTLPTMAKLGMLPTPVSGEWRDTGDKVKGNTYKQQNLTRTIANNSKEWGGSNSQLNPRFVAEMMGFPPNWLELPFQNTETNP
jgi:hypothetical protein